MSEHGPPSSLSGCAGFTILEAVLATALMGIIMTALSCMTSQWLRNWNRGFSRVQGMDLLAAGLDRLVADVAAAEIIAASAAGAPLFDGGERVVTFVRTAIGPDAFTGLEIVRIEEASDNRGPALIRSTVPFTPAISNLRGLDFSNPVVLMRAPYRVSFSYAGPDRRWKESWRGALQLPREIRVSVRDASTSRPLAMSTSAVVHAEIPAGCAAAKAVADCAYLTGTANEGGRQTPAAGAYGTGEH